MKRIAAVWLFGLGLFAALLALGSAFNYRTQTIAPHAIPEEHCEAYRSDYVACASEKEEGRFFVTGWPEKAYCYDSGKVSCSRWDDYLAEQRSMTQRQVQAKNNSYILFGAASFSLLTVGIILSVLSMMGNRKE